MSKMLAGCFGAAIGFVIGFFIGPYHGAVSGYNAALRALEEMHQ